MNRRIKKKKQKNIEKWVQENHDNYNIKTGEYKTIPVKCYSCEYFESGDSSVGALDGCITPALYDKDDNIIEKVNDKVANHMSNLGYTCPYYKRCSN